jgi:hypothetical protein
VAALDNSIVAGTTVWSPVRMRLTVSVADDGSIPPRGVDSSTETIVLMGTEVAPSEGRQSATLIAGPVAFTGWIIRISAYR